MFPSEKPIVPHAPTIPINRQAPQNLLTKNADRVSTETAPRPSAQADGTLQHLENETAADTWHSSEFSVTKDAQSCQVVEPASADALDGHMQQLFERSRIGLALRGLPLENLLPVLSYAFNPAGVCKEGKAFEHTKKELLALPDSSGERVGRFIKEVLWKKTLEVLPPEQHARVAKARQAAQESFDLNKNYAAFLNANRKIIAALPYPVAAAATPAILPPEHRQIADRINRIDPRKVPELAALVMDMADFMQSDQLEKLHPEQSFILGRYHRSRHSPNPVNPDTVRETCLENQETILATVRKSLLKIYADRVTTHPGGPTPAEFAMNIYDACEISRQAWAATGSPAQQLLGLHDLAALEQPASPERFRELIQTVLANAVSSPGAGTRILVPLDEKGIVGIYRLTRKILRANPSPQALGRAMVDFLIDFRNKSVIDQCQAQGIVGAERQTLLDAIPAEVNRQYAYMLIPFPNGRAFDHPLPAGRISKISPAEEIQKSLAFRMGEIEKFYDELIGKLFKDQSMVHDSDPPPQIDAETLTRFAALQKMLKAEQAACTSGLPFDRSAYIHNETLENGRGDIAASENYLKAAVAH